MQPALFGEIWLEAGEKQLPAVLAKVDDYEHARALQTAEESSEDRELFWPAAMLGPVWCAFYNGGFAEPPPCSGPASPMIENLPVKTLKHKALTVEGYSRAAVQTYWRIPELKLGFDLGPSRGRSWAPRRGSSRSTHLDHIASLPVYVARRRMMKMEPPTIYLPEPPSRPCRSDSAAVHEARPRPNAVRAASASSRGRDRTVAGTSSRFRPTKHTVP